MEIGETLQKTVRALVVSGAMLSVSIGAIPANAEEPRPEGTTVIASEITGEPNNPTTSLPTETEPQNEDDGWDNLGDGLQYFGIMMLLLTASGVFSSDHSSSSSHRRRGY